MRGVPAEANKEIWKTENSELNYAMLCPICQASFHGIPYVCSGRH
jgi:hypothetical protein